VGLLDRRSLAPGEAFLIVPQLVIHMFLAFPIDAVYVNRRGEVVGGDEHLAPWRIGRFYRGVGGSGLPAGRLGEQGRAGRPPREEGLHRSCEG
jgi:hypothetical protein